MISQKVLRLVAFRVKICRFTPTGAVNWRGSRLRTHYSIYRRFNTGIFLVMVTFNTIQISIFLAKHIHPNKSGIPEEQPAPAENSEVDGDLRFLGHLIFGAICAIGIGIIASILFYIDRLVDFFNMIVTNDLQYQETFDHYIHQQHSQLKNYTRLTELFTGAIVVCTIVLPIVSSTIMLHPLSPFRRIMKLLEIVPEERPRLLFAVQCSASYATLAGADIVFLYLQTALLYLRSTTFWQTYLYPQRLSVKPNGKLKFECRLGCQLEPSQILTMYKQHQVLTQCCNDNFSSVYLTAHHGSTLLINTSGLFITIRHTDKIFTKPGYQMAPICVAIPTAIEYYESVFGQTLFEGSQQFVNQVKALTESRLFGEAIGKETKGKLKEIKKTLKSYSGLEMKTGYPFFAINRGNFLAFMSTTVDNLVNLLVSY